MNIETLYRFDDQTEKPLERLLPDGGFCGIFRTIACIGDSLSSGEFESMNEEHPFESQKELMFGIYSRPGAVLITVDDTGTGICTKDIPHIFENGYSTKGEDRGTGLYQAKTMVDNFGGTITVESQEGIGTSFSISFTQK